MNVFSWLFILIMGYPAAYACNHNKTQGTWKLVAVIANPTPEFGLQPFPEDIAITSTEKNEGTLTIKLPAQSGVKIYPFSQTQSKITKSIQTYYVDTEHEFTHREQATTSCSGNTLQVNLIWKSMDEEETAPGRARLCLPNLLRGFLITPQMLQNHPQFHHSQIMNRKFFVSSGNPS